MESLRRATAADIPFIIQNRHDGDGGEFLRRFAVANAGRGFGKPFLSALIALDFHALGQHALSSACPG